MDRLTQSIGTFEDPIVVKSAGEELQCGCTGSPADSHGVRWCVVCLTCHPTGVGSGIGYTPSPAHSSSSRAPADKISYRYLVIDRLSAAMSVEVVSPTISRDLAYYQMLVLTFSLVYKMQYVGPLEEDEHHHGYTEPKTMADYVGEDYWYR